MTTLWHEPRATIISPRSVRAMILGWVGGGGGGGEGLAASELETSLSLSSDVHFAPRKARRLETAPIQLAQ